MNRESSENTNRRNNSREDAKKEIERLLASGKTSETAVFRELMKKYGDNEKFVDQVFDSYKYQTKKLKSKAEKFKDAIFQRYGNTMSPRDMIKKARKYSKNLNLSDSAFNYFIKLILKDRQQKYWDNISSTRIAKTLGRGLMNRDITKMRVEPKDMDSLNKILQLNEKYKELHKKLITQSLTYDDCSIEAVSGTVTDKNRANKSLDLYSYVHPLIAALFLPKVKILEHRFLYANIGEIIKKRYNDEAFRTSTNNELYFDLVTDPNDTVCDYDSPMNDLFKRYQLQLQLWDCVFNLRSGTYFGDSFTGFNVAINNCRDNVYDSSDIKYVDDEGTMLRKLFGAFSFRPTTVSTSKISPNNLLNNGVMSFQNANIGHITHIPAIPLRIPLLNDTRNSNYTAHLKNSFDQQNWYLENGLLVPKKQEILHSHQVLFFYVGRRYHSFYGDFRKSYNAVRLPPYIQSTEKINKHPVNFDHNMVLMNDSYTLRSVVCVKMHNTIDIVVGCNACIIVKPDDNNNLTDDIILKYDPIDTRDITLDMSDPNKQEINRVHPITRIEENNNSGSDPTGVNNFETMAQTLGTVFMYVKDHEGAHPYGYTF